MKRRVPNIRDITRIIAFLKDEGYDVSHKRIKDVMKGRVTVGGIDTALNFLVNYNIIKCETINDTKRYRFIQDGDR